MTRIKICGITNLSDAQLAVNLGADALGFVFAPSRRRITPENARKIISRLPPFIHSRPQNRPDGTVGADGAWPLSIPLLKGPRGLDRVGSILSIGVFVNEKAEKINQILETCKLDAVQLHGEESPQFCSKMRRKTKVIKAFRIKNASDLKVLLKYDVDAYLLDTFSPAAYGGTGKPFNWDLAVKAKRVLRGRPLILSGGLNPENVRQAIQEIQPYAVDVSSGVEKALGLKDKVLLEKFIHTVKPYS